MDRQWKHIKLIIAALVLGLIALCASLVWDLFATRISRQETSSDHQQVELTIVFAFQNTQWDAAVETLIEEFQEAYPQIKVNIEVSYEDQVYEDILSKKIARNELGDIVQLKTPEAYAAMGLLGEISPEVAALVSSVYTYDDTIYGVGAVESTWGVLYNKTMFEAFGLSEPETYEDFLNICQTLVDNGITPIGVGGADLWHLEYWMNHFFHTDVLSTDENWLKHCSLGTVSWTDAAGETMLNHIFNLVDAGYVDDNWLTTTDTSLAYRMSNGRMALLYTGPWTAAAIESINEKMQLGWFYVPDEDGAVYATDNLDTFWSVTAACAEDEEKYAAAMTFLEYFYSDEVYAQFCATSCTFPLTDAEVEYEADSVYEDAWQSFLAADERVSVYIGNEDTPEEFEKGMLEIVRNVMSGSVTVTEGLEKIQALWESSSGEEAQ